METAENTVLDADLVQPGQSGRRRQLLPWWIKVFAWIFLVAGAVDVIVLACGVFGLEVQLALYGIETTEPLSVNGLIISTLFIVKGFASFGLLFEKDWGIMIGKIDAGIGIGVCVFMCVIWPMMDEVVGFNMKFRLELLLLIPYLLKLVKIERPWINLG